MPCWKRQTTPLSAVFPFFKLGKDKFYRFFSCCCFFNNGRLSAAICVIYSCTCLDGSKSRTDSISVKAYFYSVHVTGLTVLAHRYTSRLLFNYTWNIYTLTDQREQRPKNRKSDQLEICKALVCVAIGGQNFQSQDISRMLWLLIERELVEITTFPQRCLETRGIVVMCF